MIITKIKTYFSVCILFIFFCLSTSIFAAEKDNMPKIAFMPFENTMATGPNFAEDVRNALGAAMKKKKVFDARSWDDWLDEKYSKVKAAKIEDIISRAKQMKFAMKYVCYGTVFKIDYRYGVKLTLYSMDDAVKDSQYLRYFTFVQDDENSKKRALTEMSEQIVDEMKQRAVNPKKSLLNKTIYVSRFTFNLIQTKELKATGDKIITPETMLEINGTEYSNDDRFFHELLAYRLHTTGLFNVKCDDINNYVQQEPVKPKDTDYIVSGNVFIEKNFCILLINIKDGKTDELLSSYKYPFNGMQVEILDSVIRKNAFITGITILDAKEREKVGSASILVKKTNTNIFCNNYYLGMNDQTDMLLPFGENDIRIDEKMYKMFVLPYSKNEQYWEIDDSIISQILKIIDAKK
jgi:hypothetical protein